MTSVDNVEPCTINAEHNDVGNITNSNSLPAATHEDVPVPYSIPTLSKDLTVWVITDHANCRERLASMDAEAPWKHLQVINPAEIESQPMHFLSRLQCETPDLVWVMLPYLISAGSTPLSRTQAAVRVIIQQQLQSGNHVCVEGVTSKPNSRGFYLPEHVFEQYERLQCSPVWWCALGVPQNNPNQKADCNHRLTATTFPLPSRYLSCCGRFSRKRGVKPKRNPKTQYLAFVKLLRECFAVTLKGTALASSDEHVTTNATPTVSTPAFQENTAQNAVSKRKRGVGVKTTTEDDGPGEHEDVIPPKTSKEFENCFDDCGDDLTPILDQNDAVHTAVEVLFYEHCSEVDCTDIEEECLHVFLSETFDHEFMSWHLAGSEQNSETELLNTYPNANHCVDFDDALVLLSKAPGDHDIMEIFGGEGKCTQIAIRRRLKAGPNMDIVLGVDLTDAATETKLWEYLKLHQPKVIVMGPPCTSFSPWSHYNRVHHFETWSNSRKIGMHLARICAQVCYHQLSLGFHFIVENPWASEIWRLVFWQLINHGTTAFVRCDQCMLGLKDPAGVPTLKATGFLASHPLLVKHLNIRCDGSHTHQALEGQVNGISRCKFAQAWPHQLCERIVQGIIDLLMSQSVFAGSASTDPYGGQAAPVCRGCKAHAARHDPRHTRQAPSCRFPLDESVTWSCPACKRFLPSTHATHTQDENCQWSYAPVRRKGYERVPATLREPRAPHAPPNIAPDNAPEDRAPPPVNGVLWSPIIDLETRTTCDSLEIRDGWHKVSQNEVALVQTNSRHLRTCEPRFNLESFPLRSVYGRFPENVHSHGTWWVLQSMFDVSKPQNAHWQTMPLSFGVPVLILIFTRGVASTEKKTRDEVPPQNVPRRVNPLDASPIAPAEPPEHDIEEEPPPVIPDQEPGDGDAPYANPEWSSFDLGRCLRALRSEDKSLQSRALKRLHVRWWHCTSGRMQNLLRAAGVAKSAITLIPDIVNSCKICRAWQRPSNRSVTTSRLSSEFGENVQFDLLFIEDKIIGILIDESTRWTVADVILNKEASSVLRFITDRWLRIFGAMQNLISDQEGALVGEEASIWLERHGISGRAKAKYAHAYVAERHHAILRDMVHKILGQVRSENIACEFDDVLSEAVFCKNIFVNVGGYSPFQAVLGRVPSVLADLDAAHVSALDDSNGGLAGLNRHAIRLREIAVASMVESTAQTRMRLAETTKTRRATEHLDLRPGEQIDVYRDPGRKDLSGWRGPATVLNAEEGTVNLRWGNRTMTARTQDVRRHIMFVFLIDYGSPAMHALRQHILQMDVGIQVFAWISTEKGWQISKSALERPNIFKAVLHVAMNQLGIHRCLGARLGRGFHVLSRLYDVVKCYIIWWPADRPAMYRVYEHDAKEVIKIKQLVPDEGVDDICWIQFLSSNTKNVRNIKTHTPDVELTPFDPDEPGWAHHNPSIDHSMSDDPSMVGPSPFPSAHSMSTQPISSIDHDMPPPPPWQPPQQRIPVETGSTVRSRSTHRAVSTTRVDPSPILSRDKPSRPIPSNSSSNPRQTKLTKVNPESSRTHGGSSSSNQPNTNFPSASNHAPLLPIDDSDDESLPSTIEQASDLTEADFLSIFISKFGDGGSPWQVYTSDEGEVIAEKALGELTPQEVKLHWDIVSAAIRSELKSFSDLGVFKISPNGTTGNCMSSRWVLRWKLNPETKEQVVKARLTVRGFLDKDQDWLETFASTASRWGQKLVVAIAVQNHWTLLTADVGAAFLRGLSFSELSKITGNPIRRCAFKPPAGYADFIRQLPGCESFDEHNHELEMLKPVYGLKDAPRAWRQRLHMAMTEMSSVPLRTDSCIYVWRRKENDKHKLIAICSAHVDDLKIAGEPATVEWILQQLSKWFGELKVQRGSFEHCGIVHELQPDNSYHLHQNHFAQRLKLISLTDIPVQCPTQLLSEAQLKIYMSGLGSLAWLVQTRADCAIYIQALQRATKKATVAHLMRLNTVIRWCRRKPIHLAFVHLSTAELKILVISDAAFRREDNSGLAMRGALIAIAENHPGNPGGKANTVEYYSRRQRRIVRSTFGAETNGAADAVELGRMIAYTLAEILVPDCTAAMLTRMDETGALPIKLQLLVDCKSLFDTLKVDEIKMPRESSLVMLLHQLKESLRTGSLSSIVWVDTRDMLADALNKGIIARKAIIDFCTKAYWSPQFPFSIFSEKRNVSVPSVLEDSNAI